MKTNSAAGLAGAWLGVLLSACGGGGGGGPAPAPLPQGLSVTAAAQVEDGAQVQFASSATNAAGLTFAWDFGDGTSGSGASAQHAYAASGPYHVTLTVSNAASESVSATFDLQAGHFSNVAGLACTGASSGGWCWQDTALTGQRTWSANFVSNSGWVVGDEGTLAMTTDGGNTWSVSSVDAPESLNRVRFRSATEGIILGIIGAKVLKTADGGLTWTQLQLPAGSTPGEVIAYDDRQIVVDDSNATYASHDDGLTWSTAPVHASFVAGTDCWAVVPDLARSAHCTGAATPITPAVPDLRIDTGGASPDGRHLVVIGDYDNVVSYSGVSDDGGETWSWQAIAFPVSSVDDFRVLDGTHAELLVQGVVWLSSDGGRSWTQSAPWGGGENLVQGFTDDSSELFQVSTEWLTLTTDGGSLVSMRAPENTPPDMYRLPHVWQWNGTDHAVVSYDGRYYVTNDAGSTWTRIIGPAAWSSMQSAPPPYFYPPVIAFGDAKHGAVLHVTGLVQSTADGGRTWNNIMLPPEDVTYPLDLAFSSPQVAWLTYAGNLYTSSDAGAHWTNVSSGTSLAGLAMRTAWADDQHGWLIAQTYANGVGVDSEVFATSDAGATWQPVNLDVSIVDIRNIAFESAQVGLVVVVEDDLTGHVLRTSDGGVTWKDIGVSTTVDALVYHVGAHSWWANGSPMLHSTDDGMTWTSVDRPSDDIAILGGDDTAVVAIDDNGNILFSADSGTTWQASDTHDTVGTVAGVALDPWTVWTVTYEGAVRATATGGR